MMQKHADYLSELTDTLKNLDMEAVMRVEEALIVAVRERRHVFVLGNGGSAAAATHWACDFNKGVGLTTGVYPRFISLSDQLAAFTAIGNDIGYESVFSLQLKALMQPGDVVLLLSVSGRSPNLIKAAEYARAHGGKVIGILGDYQGQAAELSDVSITIPSQNYGVVEDIHMTLDHMISHSLMERLGKGNG